MRNPVAEVLEATVCKMNEYHPVAEVLEATVGSAFESLRRRCQP
jgi:hypothetical protein